ADGTEQRSQDPRPRGLEVIPKWPLRPTPAIGDRRQGQENGPVVQIWPANHILDAIEKNGACGLEQHLVLNWRSPKLASVASRQNASESAWDKLERLSKARTWELLAAITRSRSSRTSARTGAALDDLAGTR